ncbi:hypothetical protein RUM43_000891 [Polyplax serrata]|uniref:Phospholipid-transporting ATPase n=1 Tax=Polyplax serrata TaxID=468196 RepID=A0AAN8SD07_POLSC
MSNEIKIPYIRNNDHYEVSFSSILKDFFCFVALYNYVIPISLYVTLELQKFLGTLFFEWDIHMYDPDTNETAICNTSDLNEDLGQIEYLFTDKTGTLTKNEMQFERCSVNGSIFEEKDGYLYPASDGTIESPIDLKNCSREMELFLCALALCHTVQTSKEGESYNATSPDEKALVEATKKLGIVFEDDDDDMMALNILGQSKMFKKLDVLEFSSERKRMSVIIEDEEENIILYCKGAETSVIPQVKKGPKEITLKHVAEFATQRLRTLVVGYKFLTRDQYLRMSEKLKNARQTLSSEREAVVSDTYRRIESNLTVLGATGIRDDIQDGVKETLSSLKEAGIKIWMLTGDKLETAENVSLNCGHFEENFIRLILQQQRNPDSCREILSEYLKKIEEEELKNFGLIVDGESLTTALAYNRELFRKVCTKCSGVICSRMSPLQKKEVVKLIKDQRRSPITAAIGDGANDVSMIQEAHVGIGIMGKEGRQAARCSDFAFSKFKYLRRTFLVHGHWYYLRVATLVQYFFYKNLAFVLPQFFYLFFSGYSAQSLYDGAYLTGYNTIFTSFPILIYGLFEQNYKETELEKEPALYLINNRNTLMSWRNFLSWFSLGLWHSIVVFFFPTLYNLHNSSTLIGGRNIFLESFGTLVFHCSVTVTHLNYFPTVIPPFTVLVSVFVENFTSTNYWAYLNLLGSPSTWLLVILVCTASLLPDFTDATFDLI